jgi:hypothetical protein
MRGDDGTEKTGVEELLPGDGDAPESLFSVDIDIKSRRTRAMKNMHDTTQS